MGNITTITCSECGCECEDCPCDGGCCSDCECGTTICGDCECECDACPCDERHCYDCACGENVWPDTHWDMDRDCPVVGSTWRIPGRRDYYVVDVVDADRERWGGRCFTEEEVPNGSPSADACFFFEAGIARNLDGREYVPYFDGPTARAVVEPITVTENIELAGDMSLSEFLATEGEEE